MVHRSLWQLRNDPFYPEVDANGDAYPRAAAERSLNPTIDPRVTEFYFDVYDWRCGELLGGISHPDGLKRFPSERTLASDSPLLVLISGGRQTGLDSLANLILHKVRLVSTSLPIVVDVVLESRDKEKNLAAVARSIIDAIEFLDPPLPGVDAIVKRLEERYQRLLDDVDSTRGGGFSELFQVLKRILAPLNRGIVIRVLKGGDDVSWARIQESVSGCCSHVIVMTSDTPYAKTCYTATVSQQQNVAWVQAEPLDRNKTLQYLEMRIKAERIKPIEDDTISSCFPFTTEAVDALFEPGSAGSPERGVRHPVGWIRRALHQALSDRVATIRESYPAANAMTLSQIDPGLAVIGPAQVRAAFDKLNGRR